MQIYFDPQQNYDCLMCGRGCRAGWDIPVEAEVLADLEQKPLVRQLVKEQGAVFREAQGQIFIQNSKEKPDCPFLGENNLCRIHKEYGFQAKPATCKLFPFVMTQTPEGIYAGVTYYCTATRQNHGRKTSEHEADLRILLQQGAPINRVAADGLVVFNRYYISYQDYLKLESQLLARAEQVGLLEALAQATLGLACVIALLPVLEDGVESISSKLSEMWDHPAMPMGSSLQQLSSINNMQLCDYFKFSLERSTWDEVESALYQGSVFSLPHYHWQGTVPELNQLADDGFDLEIARYLRHLIWRKGLVVHPPLLPSLLQFCMLPQFLKVHTGLFAHRRGGVICDQDYWDALEEAETYLVTHGRTRRVVNELGVDVMLNILRS